MARAGLQINISGSVNPRAFAQAQRELAKLGAEANRQGNVVSRGMSKVGSGIGTVTDKIGSSVSTIVAGAGKAGIAIAALALAVGSLAVKEFSSLEDSMTPVGTLLGTHSQEFKALSGEMRTFIGSSPQSADEIGMAAYTALSAGISGTTNVMAALDASRKLAMAGLGSMGESTNLITSALNSFSNEGLTADQAARAFFGTIASGKTTTAGLAQGFGQIAPLAAAAGVKFNDLLAATAALTSTGQEASVAYSGIKGAISAVIKPSAEAETIAKKLGLAFSQQHLKAVGLPKFLDEVKNATHGNVATMSELFGGVEGLNTVLSLTGPQAAAFQKNLKGIGTAGDQLNARAAEVADTLSNRFATMRNRVSMILADLGMKIVHALDPVVAKVTTGLRAMAGAFSNGDVTSDGFVGVMERIGVAARRTVNWFTGTAWPLLVAGWLIVSNAASQAAAWLETTVFPRMVNAGRIFVGWVTGTAWPALVNFGSLLMSVGGAIYNWVVNTAWPALSSFASAVATFAAPIVDFVAKVAGAFASFVASDPIPWLAGLAAALVAIAVPAMVTATIGALTIVLGALGAAVSFLLSPVVLIVAAIAAVAVAAVYAYRHFEGFRKVVQSVANFVVQKVVPFFKMLARTVVEQVGHLAKFWSERWDSIKTAVRNVLIVVGAVIYAFVKTAQTLWDTFGSHILDAVRVVWDTIVGVVKAAVEIVSGIIDVVLGVLSLNWSQVWNGLGNILSGAWDAIIALLRGALRLVGVAISAGLTAVGVLVVGFWNLLPGRIWNAVGDVGKWLWGKLKQGFSSISNGVSSIVDGVVGFFNDLPGRITDLAGDVGSAALDIGSTIISKIGEGLKAGFGFIADIGKGIVNAAIGFVNDIIIDNINRAVEFTIPTPPGFDDIRINPPDIPHIPKLAAGGIMRAAPGGRLVRMAEAGYDEAAIPLGSNKGRRALSNALADAGASSSVVIANGAVQVTIHADRETDVVDLERRTQRVVTAALADLVRTLKAQGTPA